MRSSRKSVIASLGTVFGAAVALAQTDAPKKGAGKKDEKKTPKAGVAGAKRKDGKDEPIELPIPKGQPQQGVKIPLYDSDGRLRMRFEIGVATWVDEENIKMSKLRIETFKEDGVRELNMDLPDAMLNKRTQELSSKVQVIVKRGDFEITGNTMSYNLGSGAGTLGGGVKMIIYNLDDEAGGGPREDKTLIELKPEPKKDDPK